MTAMRRVTTPRLVLEPQVAKHADAMFALLQDPAIYEHENEPPASIEWLRERFRKLESRTSADGQEAWLNWVVRGASSELMGYVQATIHRDASAAIAYVFASRYWGRGFASEAVDAMLAELAEYHSVRSVHAVLKRDNLRSIRLLERCGFTRARYPVAAAIDAVPDEWILQRELPGETR